MVTQDGSPLQKTSELFARRIRGYHMKHRIDTSLENEGRGKASSQADPAEFNKRVSSKQSE